MLFVEKDVLISSSLADMTTLVTQVVPLLHLSTTILVNHSTTR